MYAEEKKLPVTDFLWSWRLQAGYFYETDEEIEEQETYFDAQYRHYREQAWRHYGEKEWKDVFADIPKAKPTGLDAAEVKRRTSFVRALTAAGHLPVRVAEGRYKIKCPFHNEKSGSCFIYEEDKHYHCFGCQAHGDIYSFIQKAHDATFVEAVAIANHFC